MRNMATRIGATQLARGLGDVLGRIRYRGESFLVERNGVLVAKIEPLTPARLPRLRDVVDAWSSVDADSEFANDLARVGAADPPAHDPWA
jgi:antitoxin (DNA-binding transcriptional repressor) of toxin-antitoxin stability system